MANTNAAIARDVSSASPLKIVLHAKPSTKQKNVHCAS